MFIVAAKLLLEHYQAWPFYNGLNLVFVLIFLSYISLSSAKVLLFFINNSMAHPLDKFVELVLQLFFIADRSTCCFFECELFNSRRRGCSLVAFGHNISFCWLVDCERVPFIFKLSLIFLSTCRPIIKFHSISNSFFDNLLLFFFDFNQLFLQLLLFV